MTPKELKHIAKIINYNLSWTNGWVISDVSYQNECLRTAKKIEKYLNRKKP